MADSPKSIFSKRATEKLRNPDDLELYVRVANPSIWAALVACAILLAGLLTWGVFGSVTTNIKTTGTVINGEAMCFIPVSDIAEVNEGDAANFGGTQLEVADVADTPISRNEVHTLLGNDYLVDELAKANWVYKVNFAGDTSGLQERIPQPINITVERMAPISLILNRSE